MIDQQLYIDGQLMDVDNNTKITLCIKSNLFRDVTKMTTNNTYTVYLPKTVHNLTIMQQSDKPKSGSKYPYVFHRCRYFRNGLEIIKDGRATLITISDKIEISIYWGLLPVLADISSQGLKLTDLDISDKIAWNNMNDITSYDDAIRNGIFYASYNPFQYSTTDSLTIGSYIETVKKEIKIELEDGAIKTGESVSEQIDIFVDKGQTDYKCAYFKVRSGDAIVVHNVQGGTIYRSFVVLDSQQKVILMSQDNDNSDNLTLIPSNGAVCIINTKNPETSVIRTTCHDEENEDDYFTMYMTYNHPAVLAPWLLDKIRQVTGLAFEWSGTSVNEYINTLAIPLVSNKPTGDYAGYVRAKLDEQFHSWEDLVTLRVFESKNIINQNSGDGYYEYLTVDKDIDVIFDLFVAISVSSEKMMNGDYDNVSDFYLITIPNVWVKLTIEHYDSYGQKTDEDIYETVNKDYTFYDSLTIYKKKMIGRRVIITPTLNGKFSLKAFDRISLRIVKGDGQLNNFFVTKSQLRIYSNGDGVMRGGDFPVKQNLPDIKVLDMVNCLNVLTSSFPLQKSSENTVRFANINDLWSNRENAEDWSSKIIAMNDSNKAKNIQYSIDGFSQRNLYKWKSDKQNVQNHDGALLIKNETLEKEQTVITFPFAASDGNRIPIYSPEIGVKAIFGEDPTYKAPEYKGCEPRLVRLVRTQYSWEAGGSKLIFDDSLDLQNVIDTRYKNLQKVLTHPHVIKEYFYLSDLDIMNFDETIPIYLRQYGAYFAVTELKVSDKGYTEATMLQLEF